MECGVIYSLWLCGLRGSVVIRDLLPGSSKEISQQIHKQEGGDRESKSKGEKIMDMPMAFNLITKIPSYDSY